MIARALVLQGANGVRLQAERIRTWVPADSDDPCSKGGQPIYAERLDAEFFVHALWRMVQGVGYAVRRGRSIFDAETRKMLRRTWAVLESDLHQVRTMRNVVAHIDNYEAHRGDFATKDLRAVISSGPMYGEGLPEPRLSIGVTRYRPADRVPAPGMTGEPLEIETNVIWVDEVEVILRDYVDPPLCRMCGLPPGGHTPFALTP